MAPVLALTLDTFPDDVRLAYRHFPLTIHDKAPLAAQAAEAAALQGEFWTMHEHLFAAAGEWVELSPEEFETWLVELAAELGLDSEQFAADLTSDAIVEKIQGAFDEAAALGVPYTPFIIVNGNLLPEYITNGSDLITWLKLMMIPLAQLSERQFSECPPIVIDPAKEYVATLHTEKGDILIALYPEVAPFAVNNFVFLAQNDWYDNVTFHRVLEGFMAQGGDPSGTGMGNPGYLFSIEVNPNLTFDRPGLLAMANAGPAANGSQFFITYGPAEHLDGQFTIFGEVIEGMDVAESLTLRNPQADPFAEPGDLILDVTIQEK